MNSKNNNEDGILVNNFKEDVFTNETSPHRNALYNYALKISGNSDDAQDLVQETYYKAYRHFDKFESGTNSKAWMFMILKNSFINDYRKSKREPYKLDYEQIQNFYENVKSDRAQENNLDKDFYNDLLDDELTKAIDQLPSKMREVFLLCDLDGNSYEETAELVGCPIGTVRSRLHRARHMLQETLFDYAKDKGFLN
ncbi:MAG: sigma-70 family RNA polymerase sigma factor [Ignavibacteriaceae bacterium]|nr:sigma-70 family RNA polymerase sigma factor [Ignavibacteriaceae bacterium]